MYVLGGNQFLLYSPLNQGLKHTIASALSNAANVFTLQSIKSRIETVTCNDRRAYAVEFLLYSPLNQGLKPSFFSSFSYLSFCFYSTVH